MIRRLLLPLFVLALILVWPRAAAAQNCFNFKDMAPCRVDVNGPWRGVDFGAPAPEVSVVFVTRSQSTRGHLVGTADMMMSEHRGNLPGFSTAPYRFENTAPPIDCAMLRHGHAGIDSKMVAAPPARVTHSGIIVAVPPCKTK